MKPRSWPTTTVYLPNSIGYELPNEMHLSSNKGRAPGYELALPAVSLQKSKIRDVLISQLKYNIIL